jgi:hypothetical protein
MMDFARFGYENIGLNIRGEAFEIKAEKVDLK